MTNLQANSCTNPDKDDKTNTMVGKYGTLVISGTPSDDTDDAAKSGCQVTYTVDGNASKKIAGKEVVMDMLNRGSFVVDTATVDTKYIPVALKGTKTAAATTSN